MELQGIIVGIVLVAAAFFAATAFIRKSRSFSTKGDCDDDCGCSSKTKNTTH
jgi:hypothetical protein